ncbi:hypothetical protein LX36DRAFT_725136 [Colletotrichum falcatum]|nr:hypothetical protein LX36DRAFT_725136 [Colletotrichum falcatum]
MRATSQVLVGFLGTGWLAVLLVIFNYCLAFDPTANPFSDSERDNGRHSRRNGIKPNDFDVKIICVFNKLRRRLGHHSYWDMALRKILLQLCDIQLLTGLGILFSSFVSLAGYMSAYHWQIITYLAWFSNLTHAACLTALRKHLHHRQMERNCRMILMLVLLAGLVTAIFPTGYFNWRSYFQGTAGLPASNARCFFSPDFVQSAWDGRICTGISQTIADGYRCNRKQDFDGSELTPLRTSAYESSVVSIVILTLSFTSRSIKMFRTSSEIAKGTIRQKLGHWASSCLTATAAGYRHFGTTASRRKLLTVLRPLDLMIALYLVVKLYLDVLLSEMADVFWLFVSSIWGTVRLFQARESAEVKGDENEWGFGQVLAVFLLMGPITTVTVAVFATFGRHKRSDSRGDGESVRQDVSLLTAYRAGMMKTLVLARRTTNPGPRDCRNAARQ